MDRVFPTWLAWHDQAPALQGLLIVLGTFVLEDAATVFAAMDVQVGRVPLIVGLGSLYVGIVLGDVGLYGLGHLAGRVGWARRWVPQEKARSSRDWIQSNLVRTVFISRFLPGARLPTYTACGFLGVDLGRFTLAAVGATLIWTSLLFGVSFRVGSLLVEYLGVWRWVGMAGFALTVILAGRLAVHLRG